MSHFSVMVLGADVDQLLAPFHEYECTGVNDEYVQDVDETAQYQERYETDTAVRIKGPDGVLHDRFTPEGQWDHRFSKPDPDAPGYEKDRRVEHVPPGYERVEVPAKDLMDFAAYAASETGYAVLAADEWVDVGGEHAGGHIRRTPTGVTVINRTNPNAKWDWYQVGGRYSGRLKLREGKAGKHGRQGMGTERGPEGYVDVARKGDIDWAGMADRHEAAAMLLWDAYHRIVGDSPVPEPFNPTFYTGADGEDHAAASDRYRAQPALVKIAKACEDLGTKSKAIQDLSWIDDYTEEFGCTEAQYRTRARARGLCTYAVVDGVGQWHQRGQMGWFGYSSNEMTEAEWRDQQAALINGADDDCIISIVDCHI